MNMGEHDVIVLLLALATLLATGRALGELARRFHQPAVLGEIVAGLLLGPTVLGRLAPEISAWLFDDGPSAVVRAGFGQVAVCLFMFAAGLEVDLSTVLRRGRAALSVSISGIAVPFAFGLGAAWLWPTVLGGAPGVAPLHFALFFATALSISALPVIAKTLMDIGLFRSDLGMIVISAAIVEDLAGWIIFAIILGLIGGTGTAHGVPLTVALVLGFALTMLTVGRWTLNRVMPALHAYLSWPSGVLGVVFTLALLGAAASAWIGVHALFGAFLVGVAVGDSRHLRGRTRATIEGFIAAFFAPIFFASIGLGVDFVRHFDPLLVAVVLVIACAGKVLGCGLGARLGGTAWRESWAIGVAMNSRGAMEIILGLLALQAGIIEERMFVALVVMALVTSLLSGPIIQRILRRPRPRRVADLLSPRAFLGRLSAGDAAGAIGELATRAAEAARLPDAAVIAAVAAREAAMATGIEGGVAVPHARLAGLGTPIVVVGLAPDGIDFGAPDGQPARVVVLLLTGEDDDSAQLELLADVAHVFAPVDSAAHAARCAGYTEFLAALRTGSAKP